MINSKSESVVEFNSNNNNNSNKSKKPKKTKKSVQNAQNAQNAQNSQNTQNLHPKSSQDLQPKPETSIKKDVGTTEVKKILGIEKGLFIKIAIAAGATLIVTAVIVGCVVGLKDKGDDKKTDGGSKDDILNETDEEEEKRIKKEAKENQLEVQNEGSLGSDITLLMAYGSYLTEKQKMLDRINEIRKEACNEGVINPDDKTKTKKLTLADYVPKKWSTELEKMARIRACESKYTGGHKRLNGGEIWDAAYGLRSQGEILAWNNVNDSIVMINQWYEEKNDWVNGGNGQTGHYEQLISPSKAYIGLGIWYTNDLGGNSDTMCGQSASSLTGESTFLDEKKRVYQRLEVSNDLIQGNTIYGKETLNEGDISYYSARVKVLYNSNVKYLFPIDYADINYYSSDESKLTINSIGKAKVLDWGNVTVTAKYSNGNIFASLDITIKCEHDYEITITEEDGVQKGHGVCKKCQDTIDYIAPTYFGTFWGNTETGNKMGSWVPESNKIGSFIKIQYTYRSDGASSEQRTLAFISSDETILKYAKTEGTVSYLECLKKGSVTLKIYLKFNPAIEKVFDGVTCG